MQVRLIILLMCFGSLASAQIFQTNNTPYKFRGIKSDSMLVIPSGPDTVRLPSPKWGESMVGALFFRTTDSTLWGRSANKWNKLSGGGASIDTTSLSNRINTKVDKSTTLTINGTAYDLSANRSWTIASGDTTGIGDLYIRNLATPQESKRFNVKAGRLDSLYASTSAGGRIVTNTGTTVAQWGAGGGSEFDFHGFAGYNANRAANYTARSFTDKNWGDSSLALKEPIITAPYSNGRYWNGHKQFVALNTDSIAEGATNKFNANHTGDATGATALTLATVNSNVGSFTNANITVNAKGLITAAANGSGGGGGVPIDSVGIVRYGTTTANNLASWDAGAKGATANNTGRSGTTITAKDSVNYTIGFQSGLDLTTGWANIFLGTYSGRKTTTGNGNIGIGARTVGGNGSTAMTGTGNIGIGIMAATAGRTGALGNLTTGSNNIAIGSTSGGNNPAGSSLTSGSNNVLVGNNNGRDLTTQSNNTMIGHSIGVSVTSSNNTLIGASAATLLTSGTLDAFGFQAGGAVTTGLRNFALGSQSMNGGSGFGNMTGSDNVAIGNSAMQIYGTGVAARPHSRNTMIGNLAGQLHGTTANNNTVLGYSGGIVSNDSITGSNNIAIGAVSALMSRSANNQIVIGSSTDGSNPYRALISDVSGTHRRWALNGTTTDISATTPSATLAINGTSGGVLFPRLTTAEKIALTGTAGLVVYDTTLNKLCVFTTVWETIQSL
jgi:hypothetical protein